MNIVLYTTETCHFCHMAKEYFKSKSIEYEEIDVGNDPVAARSMIEKTGQMGVPVIEIDDNIIIGFNKSAIEKALDLK